MKKYLALFTLLISLFIAPHAYASTAGPNASGTVTDTSATGTVAWVNPNNAKIDDGVFTTFTTASGVGVTKSHLLELTNFNFSIPTGATINGIQVDVVRKATSTGSNCTAGSANYICDNLVSLINSSSVVTATDKSNTTPWTSTVATSTYGNNSDLWSLSWAASDINNSNFGVALGAKGAGIGGPSCVVTGTMVLTTKGNVPIQDLKVGQKIWSYSTTTKQMQIDTVTNVASEPISDDYNTLYDVTTSDGQTVKATASHNFFANGEWVAAPDLKIGDIMINAWLHKVKITSIKIEKKPNILVWNISVKNNTDFFANNELVHNASTFTGSIDFVQITVTYTSTITLLGTSTVTISHSTIIKKSTVIK